MNQLPNPPIILVHGLRGSPLGLETIATVLRQSGYDVYIPAIPPFAGAPKLAQYTGLSYANYLKQYIQAHDLKDPILIGHSMGSIVAAATAHYHTNLIDEHLILMSPIVKRPAAPFRLITPLGALFPRKIVDYLTTRFLFVPHDKKRWRETMELTHACSADSTPQRRSVFRSMQFSTKYCLGNFNLPPNSLLIAGEKDRLVGKRNIEKFAEEKHLKLDFIPNSGHLHNYEEPYKTAELILKYIEG